MADRDIIGFDRDAAQKIAQVVREHLGASGGDKTHRRADVSGPGNHVAQAVITQMGANAHKFRFVAGTFVENLTTSSATYDEVPDEYFAFDICRSPIEEGDYVWIVDHNNQWWIIDRCSHAPAGGDPKKVGCCGFCGTGGVTTCSHCSPVNAMNTYAFMLPLVEYGNACCEGGLGNQNVFHQSGCIWQGLDFNCNGANRAWELEITGTGVGEVELVLDLPGVTNILGGADSQIKYINPYPFCCNCANEMRLDCSLVPRGCEEWPCMICLLPGPKCCDTVNLATTLTATVTGNQCPCASGVTVSLRYSSVNQTWTGSAAFCGRTIHMKLSCGVDGGGCTDFSLEVWFSDACYSPQVVGNPHPCSCNPFSLTFQNFSVDGCCNIASTGATIDVVVTL